MVKEVIIYSRKRYVKKVSLRAPTDTFLQVFRVIFLKFTRVNGRRWGEGRFFGDFSENT